MNVLLDLAPGLFDNELLAEQMRKVSAYLDEKNLAVPVPVAAMPEHWRGYEDALGVRINELMAEMRLRKMPTPDRIALSEDAIIWPTSTEQPLVDQFDFLRSRVALGKLGRIRLPKSTHELWASYKYSTLARNHRAYLRFGQLVATRSIDFDDLLVQLAAVCRVLPASGSLKNALNNKRYNKIFMEIISTNFLREIKN